MFMRMTMNLLVLLLQNLVGTPMLLAVASYVLTALALYTVARRRGLKNPWLPGFPWPTAGCLAPCLTSTGMW